MRAKELITNYQRMGSQDLCVLLHYLADAACDAQLQTGHTLCDLGDFIAWLRELGDASRVIDARILPSTKVAGSANPGTRPKVTLRQEQSRWNDTCPRCGHIHQNESECREQLGGGRICRCDLPV